jgi:hypothetical protein
MDASDNKSRKCLLNNKLDNNQQVDCPWKINSPKHNNCFWQYVKDKSSIDGSMPELVQSEIAALLGWSNTKTHFMLKEATKELAEALTTYNASQLINQDNSGPVELNTFDITTVNYNIDDSEDK